MTNILELRYLYDLPIGCHVNVVLFSHESNLLFVQTCESEHPDLLDYMTPVTWCTCYKNRKESEEKMSFMNLNQLYGINQEC